MASTGATGSAHTADGGAAVRSTRQRTAVVNALASLEDFRSAQQLHDLLRHQGEQVGLTTVYRTLQLLAARGEVDVIVGDDGESVYRQCSGQHHHHLVCRECGAAIEIEGPEVELWASQIAQRHGYSDVSHRIEIFGRCPTCS